MGKQRVQRIAMAVEYDGTAYLGWQQNAEDPTLQGSVERALTRVADTPVSVVAAGRTDAGVHASGQVLHFDTEASRPMHGWVMGSNTNLPKDIAVLWAQPVALDFHARYAARLRAYRYTILNRKVRPALAHRFASWERLPLNESAMHLAAQALLGENDFTSFRTVHCQAPHARRNLTQVVVKREGEQVIMDIEANAFLHHMVRNIMGSLMAVGRGEKPIEWIAELLHAKNRALAAPTAAANGLCFLGPKYPAKWNLPEAFTTHAVLE